jgi:hypothetical protein
MSPSTRQLAHKGQGTVLPRGVSFSMWNMGYLKGAVWGALPDARTEVLSAVCMVTLEKRLAVP